MSSSVTVGDYLAKVERLPVATFEAVVGTKPFVVLSPHPDDETLGCGGLIAMAREAGLGVTVVVLTDGAGSHPNSAAYPPPRLRALRREETRRAAEALGLCPRSVVHLDVPDTRAPRSGPAFDHCVERIAAIVEDQAAGALMVTWRHDPHCDHEAAAEMADAVSARMPRLRLWHYPIWGLHLPVGQPLDEPEPRGVRLDIAAVAHRKAAAIRCYVSQMTAMIDDDPAGFHFTDATLAPFLGTFERFIEVQP